MTKNSLCVLAAFLMLSFGCSDDELRGQAGSVKEAPEEEISFKGIKFGMNAEEIAELGGGTTKHGCASAILEKKWTYGGIDNWGAGCMEGHGKSSVVPGVFGMMRLSANVASHNNRLAKSLGKNTYSVEELADVFSNVFGDFDVETRVVKNGFGQEFMKMRATAKRGGASIQIEEPVSGDYHQDYINITIESLDYLKKKEAWEERKTKEKLEGAGADF